ncbi:hypothetical protein M9Y10_034857 [Tritrichomonas musculus]|uniref:Protein kinase domain-containing protein n=1 Tax=Tritrichomonas musculus TaxID=1915356 RepID=A0ABR2KGK2_9EUKA
MRYLHHNQIYHLDLKPENILFDNKFYPHVCDYGLSACFPQIFKNSIDLAMKSEINSLLYTSPELLSGEESSNQASDIYSFAFLAFSIVTEKVPFYNHDTSITSPDFIHKIKLDYRPIFTDDFTKKMRELISRCWSPKVEDRPSFDEIFEQLSTDFSYFKETVDHNSIQHYLNQLSCEEGKGGNNENNTQKDEIQKCIQKVDKPQNDSEKVDDLKKSNIDYVTAIHALHGNERERNSKQAFLSLKKSSEEGRR